MPIEALLEKSLNYRKFGEFDEKTHQKVLRAFDEVEFQRVSLNPDEGDYENIHLLYHMLPALEQYSDIFDDDTINLALDYQGWLDVVMNFIRDVDPWFYVILANGNPQGCMWATNWESFGGGHHAVEIGGLARRGTKPWHTMATLYQFVSAVFENSNVHIIRAEFAEGNRAVKRCLLRMGFSHPEPRRCLKIRDGREITGTIISMTRPEWEALHEPEKEK